MRDGCRKFFRRLAPEKKLISETYQRSAQAGRSYSGLSVIVSRDIGIVDASSDPGTLICKTCRKSHLFRMGLMQYATH